MNEKITRTLAEQAEQFSRRHTTDLSVEGVLARAGEIRSGRRMRATIAMAAVVLAVAVPVGVTVLNGDEPGRTHRITPATQTPDTGQLGLGDLANGAKPAGGYLTGNHLYRDGIDVTVAGGPVTAYAILDHGFLVAQPGNTDTSTVSFLDEQGKPTGQTWPAVDPAFAVSPEGNTAAFIEPGGKVIAVESGGSRWFELGTVPGQGWRAVAIFGENCSGRSEGVGCAVYVTTSGAEGPTTYSVSPHQTPTALGGIRALADFTAADGGRAAGIVSITDSGSCSEVQTVEGAKVWGTCDYQLASFSPDSKHLLASPAYGDGLGDSQLAVLDAATGEPVLDLHTVTGAFVAQAVWEDDDSVLARVYDQNRWAVLRISLDGSREYAVAPAAGSDTESPYLLPVR